MVPWWQFKRLQRWSRLLAERVDGKLKVFWEVLVDLESRLTLVISRQSHLYLKPPSSILVSYYLRIYQETRRPCTTVASLWFSHLLSVQHTAMILKVKRVCSVPRIGSDQYIGSLHFGSHYLHYICLETRRPCIAWTDLYQLPKWIDSLVKTG